MTRRAVGTYAAERNLLPETARRELTELLCEATQRQSEPGDPEIWRFRSAARSLDISARVMREETDFGRPLALVVSVSVRGYR